jgi:hypothetical protein
MTIGWIIVNVALAVPVTALVAGASVFVPLRLHRGAHAADLEDVTTTTFSRAPDRERQAA